MNQEKPLIKLYRTRTFGEKISDTFDFVRENWRIMLKYITYLLLPVALIQAYCTNNFMLGYMSLATNISDGFEDMLPWLGSMALFGLVIYLAMFLLIALVYTMMQLYEQRPGRLQGITFDELRPGMMWRMGRLLVLLLTSLVVMLAIGLVVALVAFLLASVSLSLMFPALLLLALAAPLLALVTPIYLFEPIGVISAYAKSVRLGWKTWGGIVAVGFVLYFIVYIVQGVVSLPWSIMLILKNVLTLQSSDAGFTATFSYTAIQYLLGVASSFFGNCLMVLLFIGLAYQYGHACDKVDGVSVDKGIEDFETLNVEP